MGACLKKEKPTKTENNNGNNNNQKGGNDVKPPQKNENTNTASPQIEENKPSEKPKTKFICKKNPQK